jgi:hypothetical protein
VVILRQGRRRNLFGETVDGLLRSLYSLGIVSDMYIPDSRHPNNRDKTRTESWVAGFEGKVGFAYAPDIAAWNARLLASLKALG